MTRAGTRSQPWGTGEARTRLAQARKFLDVAELVADEDIQASHSVAAALAVLAGIAASDVACCAVLGRRSRSQDHHDAEQLVRQIEPGGAAAAATLRRLLDLKDTAHYGLIPVSRQRLTAALRQARSLVDFAARVSRR
jgi:hypothetical protein